LKNVVYKISPVIVLLATSIFLAAMQCRCITVYRFR